ncbi:MAG: UDP-N-acetylmuramoyl-tripeptide--D-alanyl-D-alanine ligase [Thermodesulfobacteriota bacterium]
MRAQPGPYTAAQIASACKGRIMSGEPSATFHGVCTDSREVRENDLFVPLKGTSFDGHDFLIPALEAGARGSLFDRDAHRVSPLKLHSHVLIQVQDTLLALSDLASTHRRLYTFPLIAVTGSSGKTTVKEMIATVLGRSHRPLVSEGNYNNLIGLPMTLLNLSPQHTAAVVEAGINVMGEMDILARTAAPDVAVITSIGPVHLEGLGSVENVAREKFGLVRALPPLGIAVIPAAHAHLGPLICESPCKAIFFGVESGDFRAQDVQLGEQTAFTMIYPEGTCRMTLQVPGIHNVANALAAAAACRAVGVPVEQIAAALEGFSAPRWRMETVPLGPGRVLIKDCYNANPDSMAAALEVLAGTRGSGRTLAILADMRELGEHAQKLHQDLGRQAADLGIDAVVFVGAYRESFARGFLDAGVSAERLITAEDKDTAWEAISQSVSEYSAVLVKGSRFTRMEVIADRIVEMH